MKPEHEKYAQARALGVGGRDAAISAGYAPAGAHVTASRLEARQDVQKAIAKFKRNGVSDTGSAESDAKVPRKSILKRSYASPLALMEDVMNNPDAPDSVRIEAAKQAMPYRHGKISEAGKKENAEARAKTGAKSGRFATKRGPGRPALSH